MASHLPPPFLGAGKGCMWTDPPCHGSSKGGGAREQAREACTAMLVQPTPPRECEPGT